ncbi:hypothetical protein [Aeribacillus alveayuensis]|uniref:DNA polymerase III alpha subunit (Gram-positive type) n=1 Tax=Aeribacillus alveayuensis TaxID=279215 RepID=A0ABT9VPX0_9BACI|nr:DNA polymerase III alpha subunit (gram-positive type) [Bacillus alveayuensis]
MRKKMLYSFIFTGALTLSAIMSGEVEAKEQKEKEWTNSNVAQEQVKEHHEKKEMNEKKNLSYQNKINSQAQEHTSDTAKAHASKNSAVLAVMPNDDEKKNEEMTDNNKEEQENVVENEEVKENEVDNEEVKENEDVIKEDHENAEDMNEEAIENKDDANEEMDAGDAESSVNVDSEETKEEINTTESTKIDQENEQTETVNLEDKPELDEGKEVHLTGEQISVFGTLLQSLQALTEKLTSTWSSLFQ